MPFNFFYTSNISIDRQLLAGHPFDTTFPAAAWEDIELAYRLNALGLKIRYNARAVTRHYHPMTVDSFAKRQYTVGKSGAIFYRKHPELGHFLGFSRFPTPTCAYCALSSSRPSFKPGMAEGAGVCAIPRAASSPNKRMCFIDLIIASEGESKGKL